MPEFPDTVESLILKVRDPSNRAAWDRFEHLYRPVIFRIARARGLQHADASDLVQQVLMSVAASIDRYEQRTGEIRFRNWLSRVTRNAILKALMRQPRDQAIGGSVILDLDAQESMSDPRTDALIRLEYRRELFQRAAERVRAEVSDGIWLAFELTALQSLSIEQAASQLSRSTGSIYAARSRVMRRLRDTVAQLDDLETEEDQR